MLFSKVRALPIWVIGLMAAALSFGHAAATPLQSLTIWVPDYYGGLVFIDQITYATTPAAYTHKQINVSTRSCNPNSLAVNGQFLYVVCSSGSGGADKILVYNATSKAYVKTITGLATDGNNYFGGSSLIAILFDAHGNLWVSGYNSNNLLRIPASQLGAASPLVDREVIDSPDSPAGMALDTDKSIWIVGQYDNGIVLNFPDSVLNQAGTFLGGSALNPNPSYCISNDIPGCQPVGLFNEPEGVAVLAGHIYVANNGGNAPGASLVGLTRSGGSLNTEVYGGTPGSPFSCPGGLFAIKLPNGTNALWVNDEDYKVANTDCGASSGDQGNSIGRVLEFTSAALANHPSSPVPSEFLYWGQIHTGSPGFGGVFVQAQ
jgi:hypothetical protein